MQVPQQLPKKSFPVLKQHKLLVLKPHCPNCMMTVLLLPRRRGIKCNFLGQLCWLVCSSQYTPFMHWAFVHPLSSLSCEERLTCVGEGSRLLVDGELTVG